MKKKLTQDVIFELLNEGLLIAGKFICSEHYLVVPKTKSTSDLLYKYLYDNGYISTAENKCYGKAEELVIYYINQ